MGYKHIIWDWNGTLFNDARLCVEILNGILGRCDKELTNFEDYRENFGFPVQDYYCRLGFDFSVDSFREISSLYIGAYNKRRFECKLSEGARDVISEIAARGVGQSILSAYEQVMLEEILRFFKLDDYFERVVGLGDYYAAGKVENGRKLMSELGFGGDQVLLVGDTIHDFEVAEAIGADCVLYTGGHLSRKKLESCETALIDSLSEIVELVQDCHGNYQGNGFRKNQAKA